MALVCLVAGPVLIASILANFTAVQVQLIDMSLAPGYLFFLTAGSVVFMAFALNELQGRNWGRQLTAAAIGGLVFVATVGSSAFKVYAWLLRHMDPVLIGVVVGLALCAIARTTPWKVIKAIFGVAVDSGDTARDDPREGYHR